MFINPLVSVIIPVFNSENTIKDTINSVINQTYFNIEIVVVNDGSTDRSEEIILGFNDSRIIYCYQVNMGSPTAKNVGLSVARGVYIQFLDADDCISLDKIENQIGLLNGRIDTVCVCRTQIFHNILSVDGSSLDEIDTEFLTFSKNPLDFLLNLIGINGQRGMVQPNAYLTPASLIKVAGVWSPLLNRSPDDDSEFFCRVLLVAREIIYDPISINYYRKSLNVLSGGKSLDNALGALKTAELKCRELKHLSVPYLNNTLAQNIALVAYQYGIYFPEIIYKVKAVLQEELNCSRIPPVGGKYFKILSYFVGFENTYFLRSRLICLVNRRSRRTLDIFSV